MLKDRKNVLYYSIIGLLFFTGIFLRLYQLSTFPLQVNQDELSNIYDGYSIAETGADRWGDDLPLSLRGFGNGDYRPSFYAWLCAASIKLFGPSIFAGRLPAALLGCLSLLFIFLTAKKIGGRRFAAITLFLAVFMPWHIIYSRMAHEGLIFPGFFFIASIYFWMRVKETDYKVTYLLLTGVFIGLGAGTCHAGKLIFFTFALLILFDLFICKKASIKSVSILIIALVIGALPQVILFLSAREQFMSRANNTVLPFSFTYGYINNLFDALYSNFAPHFLFFSFGEYNKHTVGRLLNVECLFFYIGLFYFYKEYKGKSPLNPAYLLILLVIAILPASLTDDNPHAIRTSCLAMMLSFFSATGILFIYEKLKQRASRTVFISLAIALILANGIYLIKKYPAYAGNIAARHQNGLVQLAQKVNERQKFFSKVFVEDLGNQPYIYFAFYCGITPDEFQHGEKKYQLNAWDGNWDHFTQIGKYYFLSPEQMNVETTTPHQYPVLFISSSPIASHVIVDSVAVDEKKYFLIR